MDCAHGCHSGPSLCRQARLEHKKHSDRGESETLAPYRLGEPLTGTLTLSEALPVSPPPPPPRQECEQLQKMYGGQMDERTREQTQQQHLLYQQEQHHQSLQQQIQVGPSPAPRFPQLVSSRLAGPWT